MSVVGNAQEMPETGDFTFKVGDYSIKRKFRVITNNILDDALVVCAAPGLPQLFSIYSSATSTNVYMRARDYEARRLMPGSVVWVVTVTYSTPSTKDGSSSDGRDGSGGGTGEEKDQQFQNPLLELPLVKWSSSGREELLTKIYDLNTGILKPVTSSSGEPYDPPPKREVLAGTLTIERNEPIDAPHPALANQYVNAVNADTFWNLPPGTWRCKDIKAERQVKQLQDGTTAIFLRVTYDFLAKEDHDIVILDSGSTYLVPPPSAAAIRVLPFLPPANPYTPVVPANVGAALVGPCTFRREPFTDKAGHPRLGALNGQGGPLPAPSTFTASAVTDQLTVPAPPSFEPGRYVNGLAVTIWNTGGALPTGLFPSTTYYTTNVSADGLSFALTVSPATTALVSYCNTLATNNQMRTCDAAGNPNTTAGIQTGMNVTGQGIPAGTTVATVTVDLIGTLITLSNSAVITTTAQMVFTTNPTPVSILQIGTGTHTIQPLGVFARIRPYPRLAFGPLALPNSFQEVQ